MVWSAADPTVQWVIRGVWRRSAMELFTLGIDRALQEQGHEVRLIPAQYVKPYVKTNKSDYIDAEAIAEAVGRPTHARMVA